MNDHCSCECCIRMYLFDIDVEFMLNLCIYFGITYSSKQYFIRCGILSLGAHICK